MAKYVPPKHLCAQCGERPALFMSPSKRRMVAAKDGHDLCRQCAQSLIDSSRARRLVTSRR